MCGLLGAINKRLDNSLLDLIKHRGPDSSGIISMKAENHTIFFAHRRLSIVELSEAGWQPMSTPCGNYSIIYNGEVYNHKDLRKKLSDIDFSGQSDTETILYYISKFGIDASKDLNGIFAFSFYDKINKRLYLVRDPNGVKPLYYCKQHNSIVFSSEIRPIKKILGPFGPNLDHLAILLKLRYVPSPYTLYDSILKVKPGEIVEIDLTKEILEYSTYNYLAELPPTKNINVQEAILKYRKSIEEAVERQLMSDVPLGILLSGGVDSAIIAKISKEKLGKRLTAFTVGFENNEREDEIQDASETARYLNIDHYYKRINYNKFLYELEKCSTIVEEPLATTSFVPMYYLSKLASEHVKVVLSGQGADEPLGGYERYQGELIRQKIPDPILQMLLRGISLSNTRSEKLNRAINALSIKQDIDRFQAIYSIFNDQEIYELIGRKDTKSFYLLNEMYNLLNCTGKKNPVERMMGLDVRLNLSDDLLLYTDKITMHFSLECRIPMLDHKLLRFIESLPLNYKLGLGKAKIIHKTFAANYLPKKIVNRKKKGFLSPTETWFRNDLDSIKELLYSKESKITNYFDQNKIEQILQMHKKGYNKEKQIFLLLALYYWFKYHE